jgi:hypothetical protein
VALVIIAATDPVAGSGAPPRIRRTALVIASNE